MYGVAGLVFLALLLGLVVQAAIASGPPAIGIILLVTPAFALSALGVVWQGWGEESITFSPDGGRVERRVGRWTQSATEFPLTALRDMTAECKINPSPWGFDAIGLARGNISVKLDTQTFRAGTDLDDFETQRAIIALRAGLARFAAG